MMTQKKILVVEDNHINRTMLCGILATEYEVLEAENGQQALELLQKHKEEISLILLDIVMPVMDGYTFLSIIKKDEAYASIPVIVTTQNDGESDEVAALSHGATDFVAKPYKPQIILHRVASIINLRETAAMINQFQYDRLTGLYSKEFFYQKVRETLMQNPDKAYDIVCSDIENFKLVNDVFGMPAGDRLLQGMAQTYIQLVGDRGFCGRFNADQFACLIQRRTDYTDAMFIKAIEQVETYTSARNVIVKWGIYTVEDRTVSVDQMCDRALLAARGIKGQYGKYFAAYDDTLRNKLLHEQAITDTMESALAQEQFEVYLQPKYRMEDDGLAGAEALVRWNHPTWGLQPPSEFIPLFEKNGFITKLDQFVWDRACQILRDWENKGYPPIPISVNVSRADIYNADLADILIRTVEKHKLPPHRLHLEITESAYTEDPEQIIATVDHLRQLGFVVEMDDFGSGYSSLNMLNQMPLDILKLDMQFIQSETAKPANQGILRFIMGIARSMNLGVVAEGVETKEQLERLREIGCDYVQGYYFARPMPHDDFERLIIQPKKEEQTHAVRPGPPQALQAILIVDEDPRYREQVVKTFEERYQIIQKADGDVALAYLASHENTLAAMILSLTLPDEGGFAVLRALEREKAVWDLPVIATGPWDPALEERALKGGADDYAGKPHLQASLLRRVQHAMGVTALWERERVLRDEAYRDYLTGLLNRRGLDCAVETLRKEDAPMAAYLFDLDDLKRVNDTFGHAEGDKLITAFGALLSAHTRDSDILARFGGDEFLIVVKQMTSEQTALQKGEEICRAIQMDPLTARFAASVSAGLVLWDGQEPMGMVIQRTDEALYRAKSDRKGGCCLWRG